MEERHSELLPQLLPQPAAAGRYDAARRAPSKENPSRHHHPGNPAEMRLALKSLGIGEQTVVVNRSDAARAKPEPDLFLKCSRLGVAPQECYAVGDAVWDLLAARRAGMLPIGLLCGGYSHEELSAAGPYRIFSNPAELHEHLEELGLQWYVTSPPLSNPPLAAKLEPTPMLIKS